SVTDSYLRVNTPFLTKCCNKWVCDNCLKENPRFQNYCPLCQKINQNILYSNEKYTDEPPSYEEVINSTTNNDNPSFLQNIEKNELDGPNLGVIHHIKKEDTLIGISLKYNVKITEIRKENQLFDDNIFARKILIIPNYVGQSLSANPSKEDVRKTLVKRFQLQSKCVDTVEAKYYMEQSNYDINKAVQIYREDILWEIQHPKRDDTFNSRKLFIRNDEKIKKL
ncbi:15228_t:CDS:2, partial [Racocetra persica]